MDKRKGLWGKFDELMSSIPDYIEEQSNQISTGNNSVNVFNRGSSASTIVQDGKSIVVKTVNGKTTITVDGKEYVAKEANG